MASEFQRRKVAGVFHAMDADGNGYLNESDFVTLTDRWAGVRGWEPGTANHDRMRTIMMGWWSALATLSDADHDDKVSLDELMNVVDQLPAMDDAVYATADVMFDAIDHDGDDRIALAEHKQVVYAWKGSDDGVEQVFPRLDADGDGQLSREEFRELWSGFWRGDDPASPSQWVLGTY
ncbi:calcium sensor EFh [Kribbella sp. ALI-6-A]|uniref:EF-hand domain-containing protein n=1 Tax=Kribbella sp. ALI-6-A TaxID=1933817 RepID=UPI00097C7B76|nr:EF-hand domain-containing protein [Kribbella sp. ALI-6-A]ONI73942.1 calcium sensor EFh [Kribbella sp. ALI-6-A]